MDVLNVWVDNFDCQCASPTTPAITTRSPTPTTTTGPPVPSDYNLPSDYIYAETDFGGIFYKRYSQMKRVNARDTCQDHGANLPIPRSAEQNEFYANLFGGFMWLGMTDEANEGIWIGDDGEIIDWFNWNRGEPNNDNPGEHAVEMPHHGFWNDKTADTERDVNCVFIIPENESEFKPITKSIPSLESCGNTGKSHARNCYSEFRDDFQLFFR